MSVAKEQGVVYARNRHRGGIYARISDDAEGLEHGVQNQIEDNLALAARENVHVDVELDVFWDNDMGASTRSKTKVRPEFERMLAAVEEGRIEYILAYSNSRLTRRPAELERLIQLHERTGVRIKTVVSGEDDLSTADGRMTARIKASVDAAEAERTAERVARSHLGRARRGIPVGGPRPFGWQADRRTLDPVEAAIAREAVERMLSGTLPKQIIREWADGGVRTTMGNEWKGPTFRQYFQSPRLAGWVVHKDRMLLGPDGAPIKGQWEPLIDETTWRRLQVIVKARPEQRARVPRRDHRHYLLTGIIRCGRCSALMYGSRASDGKYFYVCRLQKDHTNSVLGGFGTDGDGADKAVSALMERLLEGSHVTADVPAEWPREAELAGLRGRITELMEAFTKGQLSGAIVFPQVQTLEGQIRDLETERGQWLVETTGPAVSEATAADWRKWDTDAKRAAIEQALDAVLVKPMTSHGGRRKFDASRLVPVPRRSRTVLPADLG